MTLPPGRVFDGIEAVLAVVKARLAATVPDELARLEVAHGRPVPPPDDPAEPDLWRPPQLYATAPRAILEPDDYPAVYLDPLDTGLARITDVVDGAVEWSIPYSLRVWLMCRHYGTDEVTACRNRLGLAVLSALFRAPRLDPLRAVALDGWRQSWSDVGIRDEDTSTVAGWWVQVTVNAVEAVTLDPVAVAETLTLTVHPEADA